MSEAMALGLARAAFREHAWAEAHRQYGMVDLAENLASADLESYAQSSALVGCDDACVKLLDRAFHQRLDRGECEQAAECAFWLGFNLMNQGQMGPAGGWFARSEELAQAGPGTSALRGLVLLPPALQALMQGDGASALGLFSRAHELGRSVGQPELLALSGLGIGQAKIALGEWGAGLAKLDEVMVAVTAGEVSPIVSGLVYCAVIVACHDTFDVRRAAEWTGALSRWCEAQPDLVPFRGECLVHRAQILILNGDWHEATEQVRVACRRLESPPGQPGIGTAYYEAGELHRLRGEHAAAENSYRRASACGHEIQPGFALLRLAQGRLDAAVSGIRRALDEPGQAFHRPRVLAASVEIALAAGQLSDARAAAEELAAIAAAGEVRFLQAMSTQAVGAVLLAEGQPREALDELRRASDSWRDLSAPYQSARVRVLQGRCCRELGDLDAAQMEFDAAAAAFGQLGARPDTMALRRVATPGVEAESRGLTPREIQVLRAVATGNTNRAIAETLFLSEKTVARHLSNIFSKLDISSRSAATAYAYQHELM
ncbi:LuxR C-terminal-related transcriptional regulator [Arthrobacter sp. JSM 101049]|uniref:helix-turn-helix transcriptional regulator n=1 Tax=Arthrobacter sp. JSM 101049 TaxID=929097 RepID=UPI003569E014